MAVPSPLPLPHNPGETGAEVLLETEIDGVRYLLLRSCPRSLASPFGLSQREAEIARLVAAGYPNKIIAHALDISPWTVCTYLRRIFAKIGVSCRAAMVARLSVEGMVHNGLQPGGAKVAPLPAKTV
jgi:DNA-binding CsgD family transcriptional regulator